ncbi:MAG: cysteinyl-tRNA synthetase [Anaerolineae bacterium]|nr:cysteinyl-tRNA synthetase [Anaerolineae bacterium]
MQTKLGPVVLFGSGEIAASAQPVYEAVLCPFKAPVRLSILETPAGFQLNSAEVAGAVAEYLQVHLQNYRPEVSVIPARKRGTPYSPDNPEILTPMLTSQGIFLGPGSPTYAARQLRDSLAWRILQARHRQGYPIIMASAATIAASAYALPVYEIYKVGEDVHWKPGLDFWNPFGLSLVFVPHWNNNEGGEKHDTSRCYMGQPRFERLLALLPEGLTIIGIDEHTALILEPDEGICRVLGVGGAVVLRGGSERRYESGESVSCDELGPFERPSNEDIPAEVWEMIAQAEAELQASEQPSDEVLALVEERTNARAHKDWATSDRLRDEIAALGWEVRDTPQGPELTRQA